jgi:hypothetical protein
MERACCFKSTFFDIFTGDQGEYFSKSRRGKHKQPVPQNIKATKDRIVPRRLLRR